MQLKITVGHEGAGQHALSWHEAAGAKLRISMEFARSPDSQRHCITLAICLEAIAKITNFFLRCAKEEREVCALLLFDLLDDERSPVVYGLQHLSCLATGLSNRWRLAAAAYGYVSVEAFFENEDSADTMIAGVRMTSAASYRRVDVPRRDPHMVLVQMSDATIPRATRLERGRALHRRNKCCRGVFVHLVFTTWFRSPEDRLDSFVLFYHMV